MKASHEPGPQVNSITGRNGSGKSAIFAAIQIGLGAHPRVTGRASTLPELITDKKSFSRITLKLKNRGLDAFSRDKYGDMITVVRQFTSAGHSTLKLKSETGEL